MKSFCNHISSEIVWILTDKWHINGKNSIMCLKEGKYSKEARCHQYGNDSPSVWKSPGGIEHHYSKKTKQKNPQPNKKNLLWYFYKLG